MLRMRTSSLRRVMVFRLQFSVRDKPQTFQHSKPLPVGFPAAVTDLQYGKCQFKCDIWLAVGTLKNLQYGKCQFKYDIWLAVGTLKKIVKTFFEY